MAKHAKCAKQDDTRNEKNHNIFQSKKHPIFFRHSLSQISMYIETFMTSLHKTVFINMCSLKMLYLIKL